MEREEGTKQCPECGKEIRQNALLCRHCGAAFEARERPTKTIGNPVASPAATDAPGGTGKGVRFALPVAFAGACVVLLLVVAGTCLNRGTGDRSQRADAKFEAHLRKSLAQNGFQAEVSAQDGYCTVNVKEPLPREISAFLARVSAGVYSHQRKSRGLDPAATVVIYANGSQVAEEWSDSGTVSFLQELQKLGRAGR